MLILLLTQEGLNVKNHIYHLIVVFSSLILCNLEHPPFGHSSCVCVQFSLYCQLPPLHQQCPDWVLGAYLLLVLGKLFLCHPLFLLLFQLVSLVFLFFLWNPFGTVLKKILLSQFPNQLYVAVAREETVCIFSLPVFFFTFVWIFCFLNLGKNLSQSSDAISGSLFSSRFTISALIL